jgi:hypothetical protein
MFYKYIIAFVTHTHTHTHTLTYIYIYIYIYIYKVETYYAVVSSAS